jgi:HAD superfamily hydrolase (TIGR01509 family)
MHGLNMPVVETTDRKENYYFDQLPQLKAVAEVIEHVEAQYGKIPFGIVSGSTRESIVNSLNTIGLLDKFDTIVASEDYKRSKPAPDAFLLAAERLGVPPEACLVFEDADIGIQAATAAGMASIRVPNPLERRAAGTIA